MVSNQFLCLWIICGSLQIFLRERFRRAPSIYGLPSSFVQEYFCLFELLFKQSKANKFESLYIWTINNMTFEPLLPCLTTTTHANDHRKRMSCVHSLSEVNHHWKVATVNVTRALQSIDWKRHKWYLCKRSIS